MLIVPGTVLAIGVRHGRTVLNNPANPKLRAWVEVPLNRMGELDAQLAASKLKFYKPKIVYSSDLTRDTSTAEIIAKELNLPNEVDYGLRTADMGEWSGASEEKVAEQVTDWYHRPWIEAPSGESYNQFQQRFFASFDPKLNLAMESQQYRPIIFVSHGRNMAALDERYGQKMPGDGITQMPGGLMLVKQGEGEDPVVQFLGETEAILRDV